MVPIFADSVHGLVYSQDAKGTLWLADYPDSGSQEGGAVRMRRLHLPSDHESLFEALLQCLGEHSPALHANANVASSHLAAIGKIAEQLASDRPAREAIAQAKRTFGWSFLPEQWGEAVESAWARYCEAAESAA